MISIRDFWEQLVDRVAVSDAVDVLVHHGVDRAKLEKLLPADPRASGKPGAPRKWTERDYEVMLALYDEGKRMLESRQQRVTDAGALAAVFDARYKGANGWSTSEARKVASKIAKRLTDARKAVRK